MERTANIYRSLMNKAKATRANGSFEFDLDMKNGHEVTVFLEGDRIVPGYITKDYAVLTDDNQMIHFDTIGGVAEWINNNY